MNAIAKKAEIPEAKKNLKLPKDLVRYELFEIVETETIDDKKTSIKAPIGEYNIRQLKAEKNILREKLNGINAMIKAINNINKSKLKT